MSNSLDKPLEDIIKDDRKRNKHFNSHRRKPIRKPYPQSRKGFQNNSNRPLNNNRKRFQTRTRKFIHPKVAYIQSAHLPYKSSSICYSIWVLGSIQTIINIQKQFNRNPMRRYTARRNTRDPRLIVKGLSPNLSFNDVCVLLLPVSVFTNGQYQEMQYEN